MRAKEYFIQCPNCGMKYLPGEIYLPNQFLGQPKEVKRDCYNNIVDYNGIEQNTTEQYVCDNCNTPFITFCDMKFITKINEKLDFSRDYKTKINTGLTLKED